MYVPKQQFFTSISRVKKLLVVFVFSSIFVLSLFPNFFGGQETYPSQTFAAQSIATESAHVTLKVVDNTNPTTPILISPENNSYVTTSTPTFRWEESSDDRGIAKYQLWLNGNLLYDNLPTGNQENGNYIYTHDTLNGEYSLQLKNGISDGTYSWKIRVYDINNNYSESATWSFIIDTLAPTFIINSIGEVNTNISAQDLSTIPSSPIELENNEPLITATGEPNSTVVLTVYSPNDPVQIYTTTIDANGNWSLQLGIFNRGDIITLDFTITDPAGLVSVLNNVQFVVKELVIVVPPASPSPSPTISPTPSATPGLSPEPTVSTEASPTPPVIEIPYTPPREVIYEIWQEIGERLPEPIKVLISLIPEGVIKTIQELAPISAAVVATALPVATALAVGAQFGGSLSLQLFLKLLQSLGLLPAGKPQGIVFNSETFQPVSFALLTIYSENSDNQISETVVTDVDGVYRGIKLASGLYRIVVSHQDYTFPSTKKRPPYMQFKDYYLGEVFNVTSENEQQLFLIPVDPKVKSQKTAFKTKLRVLLSGFTRIIKHLTIPLFIISAILFTVFPTIWNGIVLLFYLVLVLQKLIWLTKRPIITGIVVDKDKKPLENAVVRIIDPNTNQLVTVLTTSKSGQFKVYADKGIYHLEVIMTGYVWQEIANTMSFYQVDATNKTQDIAIVMEPVLDLYDELFN